MIIDYNYHANALGTWWSDQCNPVVASLLSSAAPCPSTSDLWGSNLLLLASPESPIQASPPSVWSSFTCCCWNILPIITFPRSRTWWRWCVTVLTHLEVSVGPWTLSPQLIMEDLERLEEDLELLQALSFCLWTSKEHDDHFRLTNVQKFLMKSFGYSSDF